MILVHITERCREDAKRYGWLPVLERVKAEVEKRQSTSAFNQFPRPYFVKKKFGGRQGRLIAIEKILEVDGEMYNVFVFLTILIRGDREYASPTGFGSDPEGYGKRYLMPVFNKLNFTEIVRERMYQEPPKPKPRLGELEQLFLGRQQEVAAANELMLCESKNWVDKIEKCEDLLPRIKDQILMIVDRRVEELGDCEAHLVKVANREDYSIAYQWMDDGERLFLYDLVKRGEEPGGSIQKGNEGDVQKYLYREYPDWMLCDDAMWNALEKDRFGNFSLSPEESSIIHPKDGDGLRFPLFINGRAGSGKSTVLQYLYADYFSRYARVGKEAGRAPAYFACNHELIHTAAELVSSILLHNPRYCGGEDAARIREYVEDEELFKKSFRVYHDYLLSLIPKVEQNRYFPERRYVDYARFGKMWAEKFGKTPRADKEYGADISWHIIRTYIKGMAAEDFLELDDYQNIPKNQQSVSLDVYERIYKKVWEAWYKGQTDREAGEAYWDDQDLVRYVLEKDYLPHGNEGFLGIFCDEAQDFTHIELESFLRMSVYSERSIYPHELGALPFVFAGDPYQTLNPTGFRWDAVKAAFTEKFIFGICPVAERKNKDYFSFKDLQNNYRSISNIVRFGNSVQMLRGAKFQISNLKPQHEWKADVSRPISYFPAEDENFWKEMVVREGVHVIVPCHANEEFKFIREDKVLRKYVQIDEHSGTTRPPVFSAVRAKGLEFPCVIAYGFGESLQDDKLLDMNEKATAAERAKFLPYEYFLNRLYVAVSRPRSQLYIVDTAAGKKKLWKFAESWTELKKFQQVVPHSDSWDEHIEPLEEGTSEHLDSNFEYNPAELAERFEKTGLAEQDVAMMNYAARYYQQCKDKNNKVIECQAMALLFNKEYGSAARKFTDVRDFKRAGDCWWECGTKKGWEAMERLSAQDPNLRVDIKYCVARALANGKAEAASGVMEDLAKEIRAEGAEGFQSEKWVLAITTLVELAISKKGKLAPETMDLILELVESGVCKSSEKYAEAMLEKGEAQKARRFYEFAGVSKGAKYLRTMFSTTSYPESLAFFSADDKETCNDTIKLYLENKGRVDLTENSWRYAIAAAFIVDKRTAESVDVMASINEQSYLRNLAGLETDKAWKEKILEAASVLHLRTQSAEEIAQGVLSQFEKEEDVWFWVRVLARVAVMRDSRPEGRTIEKLRQQLRKLNLRWRNAPFTIEQRERIVPIGEFGIALEKFGHQGDAVKFYYWYYGLSKNKLVARRWFEIQWQLKAQRHGQELTRLREEIFNFARQTDMPPISHESSAELFAFDWDGLIKGLFTQSEKTEEKPEEKQPQVEQPQDNGAKPAEQKESSDTPAADAGNVVESSNDAKETANDVPKKEPPKEEPKSSEPAGDATETNEAKEVDLKLPVADALKLTYFSSKGRLNIEDQDTGRQWMINANGVTIDGVAKGHVTKMKIVKTNFLVSTSSTQIVLTDERCGYEFTIKF